MSLWLRLGLGTFVFAALAVGLALAVWACVPWMAAARIAAAERELDASDPGLRLEDILADRPEIPDGEDGGTLIRRLAARIPEGWPNADAWHDLMEGLEPNDGLDPTRRAALARLIGPIEPLRAEWRRLAELPSRRHVPGTEARQAGMALRLDAFALAQDGQIDDASRSVRAALHAALALDGSSLSAHSGRCKLAWDAVRCAERVLAQGVASEAALEALQASLLPLTRGTGLLEARRGERASTYDFLKRVASGEAAGGAEADPKDGRPVNPEAARMRAAWALPDGLRLMTRSVESARLATDAQAAEDARIDEEWRGRDLRQAHLTALRSRFTDSGLQSRRALAAARSMLALVACERYRLKHGRWPTGLADLVPAFLDAIPEEPLALRPLTYSKLDDGVVIVSTAGMAQSSEGGVHRLFAVAHRRRVSP